MTIDKDYLTNLPKGEWIPVEEAIAILRCLKDREAKCLELIRRNPHPNRLLLTILAIDMAIEALSAEAVPQSDHYKKGFEDAKRAFLVEYARESENMRKQNAQLEVMLNVQKAISDDIVRCGECKHMMPDGRCREFADDAIRPSASDFCSYGERSES